MRNGPRLRVVGWGPLRLPWENRRQQKSYQEARELLRLLRTVTRPNRQETP
jgi:hypothetical protein